MPRKTAKLDKRALFAALGYVPHDGQRRIHDSKAKRRVVASGTRFGKSMLATHEAIAFLLEPRQRMDAWLVAPTYELTKRVFDLVRPGRRIPGVERVHVSSPTAPFPSGGGRVSTAIVAMSTIFEHPALQRWHTAFVAV